MMTPSFETRPEEAAVAQALEAFEQERRRLERLHRYAAGKHDVLLRQRREGVPNARLPHGFPKYIATLSAGYMLGEGIVYHCESPEDTRRFTAFEKKCCDESLDADLAWQQAVYGCGLSLCWLDGERMRISAIDPRGAFVCLDGTVLRRAVMGVVVGDVGDGVRVYTDKEILDYRRKGRGMQVELLSAQAHPFGRMPLVEYRNNADASGDFEDVLPLVDAYDQLESDRLNDRGQFADALLVLTGVMGIGSREAPDDPARAAGILRQERMLALPDSDAKAEWLVKNPNERDIDVLRRALSNDIHKFSMTPDLEDDRFGGNLSGVAIRYKLFCMERKISMKERWFKQGLKERIRLLCSAMEREGLKAPEAEEVQAQMQRIKE